MTRMGMHVGGAGGKTPRLFFPKVRAVCGAPIAQAQFGWSSLVN
jgi:hypothetical protein